MDPKTLNALVHDHEAGLYDERFSIVYDQRIGDIVARDLRDVLGHTPKSRCALDFCCGTGFAAIGLAASGIAEEVHGCDLSPVMLDRTRSNAARAGVDVHVSLCDGERLPYTDGVFDLVVARGALHHLPSPVDGLREIRRVLAPGGTAVVLAEPTPSGERQVAAVVGTLARAVESSRRVLRRPIDEAHHQWELASMAANLHTFTVQDIEAAAYAAGFDEVRAGTAWWAWVLTLGLSYYLAGESRVVRSNAVARKARHAIIDAACALDRRVIGRIVPARHRHTVQAVLR